MVSKKGEVGCAGIQHNANSQGEPDQNADYFLNSRSGS